MLMLAAAATTAAARAAVPVLHLCRESGRLIAHLLPAGFRLPLQRRLRFRLGLALAVIEQLSDLLLLLVGSSLTELQGARRAQPLVELLQDPHAHQALGPSGVNTLVVSNPRTQRV